MPKIKGLCNLNGEEWRPAVGYEDYYLVSNKGRIKRLGRDLGYRITHTKITRGRYDKEGYLAFKTTLDKKTLEMRAHRMVAMAFIPNPNNYPQINHINGKKDDNRVENLEWCTNGMNGQHAWDTGLRKRIPTAKCLLSKLCTREVRNIRKLHATGEHKIVDLAKRYKVTANTISKIVNRQTWKDV